MTPTIADAAADGVTREIVHRSVKRAAAGGAVGMAGIGAALWLLFGSLDSVRGEITSLQREAVEASSSVAALSHALEAMQANGARIASLEASRAAVEARRELEAAQQVAVLKRLDSIEGKLDELRFKVR